MSRKTGDYSNKGQTSIYNKQWSSTPSLQGLQDLLLEAKKYRKNLMENDSFDRELTEAEKSEIIDTDVRKLIRLVQSNAPEPEKELAKHRIILHYILYLHVVSKKFSILKEVEIVDIVQSGIEGLLKGLTKINLEYIKEGEKVKPLAFLTNYIENGCRHEVESSDTIVKPAHLHRVETKIYKLYNDLLTRFNREQTNEEVAYFYRRSILVSKFMKRNSVAPSDEQIEKMFAKSSKNILENPSVFEVGLMLKRNMPMAESLSREIPKNNISGSFTFTLEDVIENNDKSYTDNDVNNMLYLVFGYMQNHYRNNTVSDKLRNAFATFYAYNRMDINEELPEIIQLPNEQVKEGEISQKLRIDRKTVKSQITIVMNHLSQRFKNFSIF